MKLKLTSLICAFALSTGFVSAQSETTETDAAQKTDEVFPVDGAQKDGKPYNRETHGAWDVRCAKINDEEGCNLYQLLKDEGGQPVAEINLEVLPEGGKAAGGATVVTPLGTMLNAKLRLQVDSGKVKAYDYNWCENAGCISRFGLTKEEVSGLKKGSTATLILVSIVNPEKPVNLTLSLDGFTDAWNSVAAN